MEESETCEFKESLDEEEVIRTLVALANTKGGKILVGVRDDGSAIGFSAGKNKIEAFVSRLNDEVKPSIYPSVRQKQIDGKAVLEIETKESDRKPHFCKGVVYKRVGKSTLRVTDGDEIKRMFLSPEKLFDGAICEGATMSDISDAEVVSFHKAALAKGRLAFSFSSVEETLSKLGLLKEGRVTNAAVLLFGNDPARFFPQHGIRLAILSSSGEMVVMENLDGNIPQCINRTYEFLLQHIKKMVRIEGLIRKETPILPPLAMREAITNALVHRDYLSPAPSYASLSTERLDVKNPGILNGLTIEQLYRVHNSVPRNPLIVKTLHFAGYIEQWGTGTTRMIEWMREAGLEDPKFRELGGFFNVSLAAKRTELNIRQKKALEFVETKGKIKASELARTQKVSIKTAMLDLNGLVKYRLLVKTGVARNSEYRKLT